MSDNIMMKTESRDSIEITKTTKGYTWNIKLYKRDDETTEEHFKRVTNLENDMRLKYG